MLPLINALSSASERDPKRLLLTGSDFVSASEYVQGLIAPKVSCNHTAATNRDRKIKADGFIDSLFAFERQLSSRNNRLKEGF